MRIRNKEITRRDFLKLGVGAFSYAALEYFAFQGALKEAKSLEIFHHVLPIKGLDKKWDRTFIVHFSDLHLSEVGVDFMNPRVLQKYSGQVTQYLKFLGAEQGKTIFIDTGDLVSSTTGNGKPTPLSVLDEGLSSMRQIPAFLYASVGGNHEFNHPNTAQIVKMIDSHDFLNLGLQDQDNYLLDSNDIPVTLVGLPDFTTEEEEWYQANGGANLLTSLDNRESQKPMIVATHTSMYDSFRDGALKGRVHDSLFLHGHAHGGQVSGKTPLQYLAGRYAIYGNHTIREYEDENGESHYYLYRKKDVQKSKYYRGVHRVGNGNVIGMSPGLGHAFSHGPRLVDPGAVIYELRAV